MKKETCVGCKERVDQIMDHVLLLKKKETYVGCKERVDQIMDHVLLLASLQTCTTLLPSRCEDDHLLHVNFSTQLSPLKRHKSGAGSRD